MKKKTYLKKIKENFPHCPSCNSKTLTNFDDDYFCLSCGWDSCKAFVEEGGMDNLFAAYIEHFHVAPKREESSQLRSLGYEVA